MCSEGPLLDGTNTYHSLHSMHMFKTVDLSPQQEGPDSNLSLHVLPLSKNMHVKVDWRL